MPTTKNRRSVPLSEEDVERIAKVESDPRLLELLHRHSGQRTVTSDSQLMHALVLVALNALETEADEQRYEALADSENDEDREFHASMRARRRDR